MSFQLPSPLPVFDRVLLRAVRHAVPLAEREEWLRSWQADLWHMHHLRGRRVGVLRLTIDLPTGILLDALWLRTECWRRTFGGTPILCLVTLQALCIFCTLVALALYGGWRSFAPHLLAQGAHYLVATPLILFVSYATGLSNRVESGSTGKPVHWLNRQLFFVLKTALGLLLAFLLSSDLARPLYLPFPKGADLVQILFFVILALLGLRWSFRDQEQRCKECLRSLAMPARVGRPSHNLLEWNGTEQICKQGHGVLSVPEMESSWRQYSQWITQDPGWDEAARI
jgi:hypothetical protein